MTVLIPLRADLGNGKDPVAATAALTAACLVGRAAVAAQEGRTASAPPAGAIVGAETAGDFIKVLTAAAVELSWKGFAALAVPGGVAQTDAAVEKWIPLPDPSPPRLCAWLRWLSRCVSLRTSR